MRSGEALMAEFKTVRGMRDLLPREAEQMRQVEVKAREVGRLYGYREIVTPIVEPYELLSAKAGEEVRSRMFVFKDLGGRNVALRPEFTASAARLVATTLRNEPKPFRLFAVGSVYRYDEPQKGRYREIWQTNYELIGSSRPEADAEILLLTDSLMHAVGLQTFAFKVGHVGVLRGILNQERILDKVQATVMQLMDKRQYDEAFRLVESAGVSEQCMAMLRRLVELKGSDVLGVSKSIAKTVKGYERAVEAARNLSDVLSLILKCEPDVEIAVEGGFARGLEYYTGMIFEAYVPGSDIALCGGGRYDRLIELFGGEWTPAVGVAHGVDRMMLALKEQKAAAEDVREAEKKVLVIPVGDRLTGEALRIAQLIRSASVPVEVEVMGRKMSRALEDANRRGLSYAVIVGQKELDNGAVVVRNLARREQRAVKVGDIVEAVKN
jgi:histidyl-tRNA synthetase